VHDFPFAPTAQEANRAPATARHLARLEELFRGGTKALSSEINHAVWPELVQLAKQFLVLLPACLPRAIAELAPLAHVPLCRQPCLRDIWHDHVLFSGDDVTGIVDFGAVDIDTPATDIARLLGSLVGDDAALWQTGISAYSTMRPLSDDELRSAKALDRSAPILAGCNWLRWIYKEGRQFEDRERIVERFRRIVARCTLLAANYRGRGQISCSGSQSSTESSTCD
jgi:Ser/Thr protein kinase RdoA (MazF antagonist)